MRYLLNIAVALSLFFTTAFGAGTGTMSVTGGFVGGSGIISGTVSVGTAGSLYPGATVGKLEIEGSLDISVMADGVSGKLAFDLVAPTGTNDQITASGTLTIGTGKLGFGDFTFTDLGGVAPGSYTLITSAGIDGSLDATNLSGPIGGYYGTIGISGDNIVLAVNSLIGSAIVDDKSGGPVDIGTVVTYTVTFSKDMDASTVTADDFDNAGTAGVSIGTVTETSANSGIFSVPVTPTTAGTLILMVKAGQVLTDVVGKNLITSTAIADDTTITVRTPYETWLFVNNKTDTPENLKEYAFGTTYTGAIVVNGSTLTTLGQAPAMKITGSTITALYGRRQNYQASGLNYKVRFSADLNTWHYSTDTVNLKYLGTPDLNNPVVVASDSVSGMHAVSIPFPLFVKTSKGYEKTDVFMQIEVTVP